MLTTHPGSGLTSPSSTTEAETGRHVKINYNTSGFDSFPRHNTTGLLKEEIHLSGKTKRYRGYKVVDIFL